MSLKLSVSLVRSVLVLRKSYLPQCIETITTHSPKVIIYCILIGIVFFQRTIFADYGDITFVVISDIHYGFSGDNSIIANRATIDYLNLLPGTAYPSSAGGGTVETPRGVIICGDLTNTGSRDEWASFSEDWGVNGEKRINYPTFEGYGNHDEGGVSVRNGIIERNELRTQAINISSNGLHYSWDWDNVHFIQLNIYAGSTTEAANSLAFLKSDLEENVSDSKRPVICIQHYGWDDFSLDWWSQAERDSLYAALNGYNIIGYFQGHWHNPAHTQWNNIDIYRDGSIKEWTPDAGECLVVHIVNDKMYVLNLRSYGWATSNIWTKSIDLGTTAIPNVSENKNELAKNILSMRKHTLHIDNDRNTPAVVSIMDFRGRCVLKYSIDNQADIELASQLSNGTYIARMESAGNVVMTKKISITK